MFLTDIMAALFGKLTKRDSSGEIKDVSAGAQLFTEINKDEPEVGNHPDLTSTDPSTLVIVKSFMVKGSTKDIVAGRVDESRAFQKNRPSLPGQPLRQPFFIGKESGEEKGFLSNGVWINVGAIKDSFTQNNTFYQGFMALLTRMNNATENYWHLDLAFDEQEQQYKVYDKKCVFSSTEIPEAYIFNEGTEGELLELNFEANFSKESKSAILLATAAKTRKEAIEEMSISGVNQPNVWTEVMNLPDLKDELGESVHNSRVSSLPERESPPAPSPSTSAVSRTEEQSAEEATETAEANAAAERRRRTRLARFDDPMGAYIASPSKLISVIAESGRRNPNKINNFVAPIPTEINLSLTMQGINGFAFYDTFLVDKLPRIYADHGVFLINEIEHGVSSNGWLTTIGGLYYFTNLTGKGQVSQSPITPTATARHAGIDLGTGLPRDRGARERANISRRRNR